MLEVPNHFPPELSCSDSTENGPIPSRRGGLLRSLSLERGFFSRLGMKLKDAEGRSNSDDEPTFHIDPENPITMMGNSVQLNFTVSRQLPSSCTTVRQNSQGTDRSEQEENDTEKKPDPPGQAHPIEDGQNTYLKKVAARRKRSNSEDGFKGLISAKESRSAPRRSRSTENPMSRANRKLTSSSDHCTAAEVSNLKSNGATRSSPTSVRSTRFTETGGHPQSTIERRRSDSMSKSEHSTRPRQLSRLSSLNKSDHTKRRLETLWPSMSKSDHTAREGRHRRCSDARSGVQNVATRSSLSRCDSSQDECVKQPVRSSSVHRRRPQLRRANSGGESRFIEDHVVRNDTKGKSEDDTQTESPIQFEW